MGSSIQRRIVQMTLCVGFSFAVPILLLAQDPQAAVRDLVLVKTIGPSPVTVGSAQLLRNDNGVTCVIHTSGLVPGDVYSVWWVMPEEALIFNAAGSIAAGDGTATFAGHAPTGPIGPVDGHVVLSNGDGSFDSPRSDTVMVIIRHHGPPVPGSINQQMGTFDGQCVAAGANCQNIQRASFIP